jgi:hypothetical protein
MTDQEWEAQNGGLSPAEANARGLCWYCNGNSKIYSAYNSERIAVDCPENCDNGKAR